MFDYIYSIKGGLLKFGKRALPTLLLLFIIGLLALTLNCDKYDEVDVTYYEAPGWTSDNKIVFIENFNHIVIRHYAIGGQATNIKGSYQILTLCEIGNDGTGIEEKGEIYTHEEWAYHFDVKNISATNNWIALEFENAYGEDSIYIVRRDGTGFQQIAEGRSPDFSPDASKIVYKKPRQGIWIMDRNGGGDHEILLQGDNPAWSPGGEKIAYIDTALLIADTLGNIIDSLGRGKIYPDWSSSEPNRLMVSSTVPSWVLIINLDNYEIDTLSLTGGNYIKWSPNAEKIIGHDTEGYYVINLDGTNKWYLQP